MFQSEANAAERTGLRRDYWLENAADALANPAYDGLWRAYPPRPGAQVLEELRSLRAGLVAPKGYPVAPFTHAVSDKKLDAVNPVAAVLGYKLTHDEEGRWVGNADTQLLADDNRLVHMVQLTVLDPGEGVQCGPEAPCPATGPLPLRCEGTTCVNGYIDAYSIIRYAELWRSVQTWRSR